MIRNLDLFLIRFFTTLFYSLFRFAGSMYKHIGFNLNLPENQAHNYHLFNEQERYNFRMCSGRKKYGFYNQNGSSVEIPILLSLCLFLTCFFFVNFLWSDLLYKEVFDVEECICPAKDHMLGYKNFFIYLLLSVWLIYLWFEHINFESLNGYHTSKVNTDYKLGFLMFLGSEVMFFFSIFWAYFHFSFGGSLETGYMWPPVGIDTISYLNLPLLNTSLLITSGLFVTWSHNSLKVGDYEGTSCGLIFTILFGFLFMVCQYVEYVLSNFNINDSVFGSIFFFGTGFHGMHVLLGTVGLIYNYFKLVGGELSSISHYSYLFTIWYWHFVDVVWLFLYLIFYVWGQ